MQSNGEFVKFLGEGAYGSVDLVKYTRSDGSWFYAAVKGSYPEHYESLNRELKILRELRGCPRTVNCFGDSLEEGLSYNGRKVYRLLLEHATEGSLSAFMDNYTDRKLPEPMIKDFTRMILEGLVSIHGHGFVHCDLKPENILVFPCDGDSSYELKISDFGNSLEVGEVPHYWQMSSPFVGTANYMPPESLEDGVVNETLDLWSLGCSVLEMYTGEWPWPGVEIDMIEALLFHGNAPEIPKSVPCDARKFIQTCFASNAEDRGSACELLSHRFLHRQKEEIVATEERKKSLMLRIRKTWNKLLDITEKPLKVKIFSSKPLQFKKILNNLARLKIMPLMKHSESNLISV